MSDRRTRFSLVYFVIVLANLLNEAALLAARENKDVVEMVDIDRAIDRIIAGLEKRNRLVHAKEREIVAYHEAGHAIVAERARHADPVHMGTTADAGGNGSRPEIGHVPAHTGG